MHKPLLLCGAFLCALLSYAQKKDTLILFYEPDQFTISKQYLQKLDSFLLQGWDKFSINGYTDETEGDEYNLELSKKRSGKVYDYLLSKGIAREALGSRYFGESIQLTTDSTGDQLALNRRTEIIGYRYARVKLAPKADPMAPVTTTLDNGFIITYRPGSMPDDMAANFASGSGINFQLISNTLEMRQNNLFNNTTRGEVLSSVLIVCGVQLNPCKLDSPILVKVPIPFATNCPIEKVKFFNAVAEKGKKIWQEESKSLYPEVINGTKYIRIWLDNFCQCINFDFKVDPDCYPTDSTKFMIVNATIKNLTAELKGFNSVYLPRKVNDSVRSLLFLKDKLNQAPITFTLFDGKRRIRTFRDQPLTAFPYDESNKSYIVSTGSHKFYFPRLKVYEVVLKVNGEKYRVSPEKNKYDFVYLNRKTETILVDFMVREPGGKFSYYKDQPLESLPYDAVKGYRVIDKKFLKLLKQKEAIARM